MYLVVSEAYMMALLILENIFKYYVSEYYFKGHI